MDPGVQHILLWIEVGRTCHRVCRSVNLGDRQILDDVCEVQHPEGKGDAVTDLDHTTLGEVQREERIPGIPLRVACGCSRRAFCLPIHSDGNLRAIGPLIAFQVVPLGEDRKPGGGNIEADARLIVVRVQLVRRPPLTQGGVVERCLPVTLQIRGYGG